VGVPARRLERLAADSTARAIGFLDTGHSATAAPSRPSRRKSRRRCYNAGSEPATMCAQFDEQHIGIEACPSRGV
jgi:hypothetical protein